MKRADFVKTAAMVAALAVLLPVAAARGADWQTTVNGYPIECTVSDITTYLGGGVGPWNQFTATYTFCNGNYWKISCWIDIDNDVRCSGAGGPEKQACSGATYSRWNPYGKFYLRPGTANAQNYVCGEVFKSIKVDVTPLKK